MNVVICGSLKVVSIKEMSALIYGIGGKIQEDISKKTDYLILPEGQQTKYTKIKRSEIFLYVNLLQAKNHKIDVITETECLEFILSELKNKIDSSKKLEERMV